MKLEDLQIYNLAMNLGEKVWDVVNKWQFFERDVIGKQLVRSADSVAANISEGFGRHHYRDVINFTYYSRGSLSETKTWLTKAFNRKLISNSEFTEVENEIATLGVKINNYIASIEKLIPNPKTKKQ